MPELPEVVLFDFDGTLIDSSSVVVDIYFNSLSEFGYPEKSKEFISSLAGKSSHETGRALGIDEEDLDKIDAYFWKKFSEYAKSASKVSLFDGVKNIFEMLTRNDVKIGVVTSNEANNADILLEKVGLSDYLDVIIGKEHTKDRKPNPEPINLALQKLKMEESDAVWFVGDSQVDVEAAKAAGIFSIAIPQLSTIDAVLAKNPDMVFDSMVEFYQFIKDLAGSRSILN